MDFFADFLLSSPICYSFSLLFTFFTVFHSFFLAVYQPALSVKNYYSVSALLL